MKFAHIADLHIGKRVHDFSMLEDQRYILEEMLRIFDEEKVDGVLIAGDVYDKTVPSAEAVQVFDDFITKLAKMEMPIYMISGNHDSAERLAFGAQLFENDGVYISPVYEGEVKKVEVEDVYVLADGSKFGQVSSVTFGEFRDAQILTEAIPEEYQESKNISKVD